MSAKWKVYRDGAFLGQMSAAEIRQALRDGDLDPFDHVVKDGSQILRELVEVDEIFVVGGAETQVVAVMAPPPDQYQQNQSTMQNPYQQAGGFGGPPPRIESYQRPPELPPPAFQQPAPSYRSMQSGMVDDGRSNAGRQKNLKKFYLIDRQQRVLGPLSATEVQSLFYRGILEKGVRVQKMGDTKTIPINSFIAAYSGQRVTALAQERGNGLFRSNRVTLSLQSSRVLNELYRGISTKDLARKSFSPFLLFLVMVAILLSFLIFIPDFRVEDVQGGRSLKTSRKRQTESVRKERRAPATASLRRIKLEPAEDTRRRRPATRRVTEDRETRRTPQIRERERTAPQTASRGTPERRSRIQAKAALPPPPPVPARSARPQRTAPPPSEPPPEEDINEPLPRPQVAPQRRVAAASGSYDLAGKEGQVVTIGPYAFSRDELDSCSLKCKLQLRGGGQTVTAVFFKGAFIDAFTDSGGRVTVTGTLKKEGGGFSIFIQSVR